MAERRGWGWEEGHWCLWEDGRVKRSPPYCCSRFYRYYIEPFCYYREDCSAHIINTVVRSTFTVPFYELRRKAVESCSQAAKDVVVSHEDAVRAVKAAPPGLAVRGVNLKTLKMSLKLPQRHFEANLSQMLQSVTVNKKKVT